MLCVCLVVGSLGQVAAATGMAMKHAVAATAAGPAATAADDAGTADCHDAAKAGAALPPQIDPAGAANGDGCSGPDCCQQACDCSCLQLSAHALPAAPTSGVLAFSDGVRSPLRLGHESPAPLRLIRPPIA